MTSAIVALIAVTGLTIAAAVPSVEGIGTAQDRILQIETHHPGRLLVGRLSEGDLKLLAQVPGFRSAAGFASSDVIVEENGAATTRRASYVVGEPLSVLGIRLADGDGCEAGSSGPSALATFSEGKRLGWQKGSAMPTVQLANQLVHVIGILPDGLRYPEPETQYWLCSPFQGASGRSAASSVMLFSAIARLRDGVDLAAAQDQVERVLPGQTAILRAVGAEVADLLGPAASRAATAAWLLLGVAGLGTAAMAAAHAGARRQTWRTHALLGGSTTRIALLAARELLVPVLLGILLALAAYAVSLPHLVSFVSARLNAPLTVPPYEAFKTSVLVSLSLIVPILVIALSVVVMAQPSFDRTAGASRARGKRMFALLSVQSFVSAMLVSTAVACVFSARFFHNIDRGFRTKNVTIAQVRFGTASREASRELLLSLVRQVKALGIPFAVSDRFPLASTGTTFDFVFRPAPPAAFAWTGDRAIRFSLVSPQFFDILQTPLREGRPLTPGDDAGPHVVAVNEAFVRSQPLATGVVSTTFRYGTAAWEIVSVYRDLAENGVPTVPEPTVFVPVGEKTDWATLPAGWDRSLSTRAEVVFLDDGSNEMVIRQLLRRAGPSLVVESVSRASSRLSTSLGPLNTLGLAAAVLAFAATLIAAVTGSAVMALVLQQGRVEAGVRAAVGASPLRLASELLKTPLIMAAVGIVAGELVGFLVLAPLAADPSTLPTVWWPALLIAGASLGASMFGVCRSTWDFSRMEPKELLAERL